MTTAIIIVSALGTTLISLRLGFVIGLRQGAMIGFRKGRIARLLHPKKRLK